jgi:hypothetical protein
MAAIEYRGLNAVTNFDLSRYIKWLKPNHHNNNNENNTKLIHNSNPTICDTNEEEQGLSLFHTQNESFGREAKEKEENEEINITKLPLCMYCVRKNVSKYYFSSKN